jgi:multimeric flavodoxin WrbA
LDLILTDKELNLSMDVSDLSIINVKNQNIASCVGCFGCWIKTPGRCVIRDDATKIYPLIAKAERMLVISKIFLACYDLPMKRLIERSLPNQQPFIRIYKAETHHVQRRVCPKELVVLAYGALTVEEEELFRRWLQRNALNTMVEKLRIEFVKNQEEIDARVEKELKLWAK